MTPAERTTARIAQNRAISEKFGEGASPKPPITLSFYGDDGFPLSLPFLDSPVLNAGNFTTSRRILVLEQPARVQCFKAIKAVVVE
jgi:hypothetical protein